MSHTLTEEEIECLIEEGTEAGLLLDNPAFLRTIEALRAQYAESILQSAPQDTDKREHLYRLSAALTEITETLADMVAEAEGRRETRRQLEEPDLPLEESQYLEY